MKIKKKKRRLPIIIVIASGLIILSLNLINILTQWLKKLHDRMPIFRLWMDGFDVLLSARKPSIEYVIYFGWHSC